MNMYVYWYVAITIMSCKSVTSGVGFKILEDGYVGRYILKWIIKSSISF